MRAPAELLALVEERLATLSLSPELHGQADSVRYALTGGGKRVRPVLCLATGEAAGASVETVMPAALGIELIHAFSLVHDDLPSLDNDAERRGQPSTWAKYGEAVAVLAGDGCLFGASVGMALWAAGVSEAEQGPWRGFGDELGLLFQVVDDILDGDGYVLSDGAGGARRIADESADRAQAALAQVTADTSVLAGIVESLRSRTV